ncbi:MAG TPA: S16 family serine protease [Acidimicrobiales bacterium]|nr:S16 family serine protease [Acidimicrobiales bacterium]
MWVAWGLASEAALLWAEDRWPLAVGGFAAIAVLAVGAAAWTAGRPPRALVVTAEGLRANSRLRRWTDIEALELRGPEAGPTLGIRLAARRRRVGVVSQRDVSGDLAAMARRVADDRGIRLDDRRTDPGWKGRLARRLVWVGIVALVVLFSLGHLVPGVWLTGPGSTPDARSRLRPRPPGEPRGEVLVLSVRDRPATVTDVVNALGGEDGTELHWYNPLRPPRGISDRARDVRAVRAAIAAGLACAGRPVAVHGGEAEVVVVPGSSPAAGRVRRHERILSVAGAAVRFEEDVSAALVGWDPSRPVPVVLEDAAGRRRTEHLPVARHRDGALVLAGVGVGRRPLTLGDTPLSFAFEDFDGDSLGLAAALTVVDAELSTPLVPPGRRVATTGSISPAGVVGPVGGIPEKMAAARRAGAELVLVPAAQVDVAIGAAGPGLPVVGVRTLAEAVVALGGAGCR